MERKGSCSVLMNRYEMGRLLGQGTFAKVYHARRIVSGQSVAIKIIDKQKVMKVGMMDQIKREISVMRLVRHPNVVELYEVMASKEKIYFAMEYVKGGELFNKVSKGKLKEDVARNTDVSDFGLSALGESRRQDGLLHTTCGTPAYVAPEIISKKGYDGTKADIWSSGVILFVLLAGYLPFRDPNLVEMYRKINRGDFKCPQWFHPEVRKLLVKVLDPNPSSRISIDRIMENSWLKKGFKPLELHPQDGVAVDSLGDVDASLTSECSERTDEAEGAMTMTPTCLNAFDIISLSPGFNLSGLFEEEVLKQPEARFTTRKPASDIVSKLEEIGQHKSFEVRKKDGMVKLKGRKVGKKGQQLAIEAKIFEVTPTFHVVELKKSAGDSTEFQEFCDHQLKPSLKDIVWTWQGVDL